MADDCGRLMTYHDYLLVRSDHRLAGEEIRELDYTFFLQVWIPKALASDMGRELSERFDIAWISEDPKEGEETLRQTGK